ncbi:MAG: DUF366 family protein [Bdellovibrionales bacterium]|nr:DUF366 family protein [Bdellovibrionales bacterium]
MKYKFITENLKYDGQQLRSLFAYLNYQIHGDSIVSWVGECDIPSQHMVDGEDLLAGAEIRGRKMVHFIIEKFSASLYTGVSLQRLFSSICKDVIVSLAEHKDLALRMYRDGDDLYVDDRKLSISIATVSPVSTLIHFAVNVTNENTPVKTLSLQELEVDPRDFADKVMEFFVREEDEIVCATQKVKWVT